MIQGIILQKDSERVLLTLDYGTLPLPRTLIKTVYREGRTNATPLLENPATNRVPDWGAIISRLSKETWATSLKQIPATVIDKGLLRHVPYISFRCGPAYEVNIYGDLDTPAGSEIGVLQWALDGAADAEGIKKDCVNFMAGLLPLPADKGTVLGLNRREDRVETNGMLLEVTPATAEDAYGGWWISAYEERKLDTARASEQELQEITVPASSVIATAQPTPENLTWTREELAVVRPVTPAPPLAPTVTRPIQPASPPVTYAPSTAHSSGGGRVYVRGYYRKDGTYRPPAHP